MILDGHWELVYDRLSCIRMEQLVFGSRVCAIQQTSLYDRHEFWPRSRSTKCLMIHECIAKWRTYIGS